MLAEEGSPRPEKNTASEEETSSAAEEQEASVAEAEIVDSPESSLETSAESTEAEAASEPEAEPEPMETVAVSEEVFNRVGTPGQLLEACPACGTLMDVTEQNPFAKIHCPSCGQHLHARKQFNNFRLLELIGEGGMGSVFKAKDCNLNRFVALKVLKKECAANAEEQAKLANEARITASINHPHVVKVFSFGHDHGQFYLAMELVEKGSLDDLLAIQPRIAELQMLEVGIQIAEGLEAALENGLIHRDIKPGNILFANGHTGKLVDFGLAIVMDQAAASKGEIWGTPYYIAPEKLDNQPEDFRSDIYSLGGTMFHALAGRPPYEAETASMVALKQLKSQAVSLQAFAPDVTSETAYVINRMLAKNPNERYGSYRELIDHLTYARNKLLERTQKPHQPKTRVVLETQETRNFTALLSLALLAVILVIGVLLYVFRDAIFSSGEEGEKGPSAAQYSASQFNSNFSEGIAMMSEMRFEEAIPIFQNLASAKGMPQPQKNWSILNHGFAVLMAGDTAKAASIFEKVVEPGPYTTKEPDNLLASFFVDAGKLLAAPDKPISTSVSRMYSRSSFEAFGLLLFAMHNWQLGDLANAGPLLRDFIAGRPPSKEAWIADYKPLARIYYDDWKLISDIQKAADAATDAAKVQQVQDSISAARDQIKSGSKATEQLDQIEQKLQEKKP